MNRKVNRIDQKREITIPVSQIDHIDQGTVYLKLDRQSVEALPTTPVQPWTRSVSKGGADAPLEGYYRYHSILDSRRLVSQIT